LDYINIAKEVFKTEADEILKAIDNIDDSFNKAIEKILSIKGKLVIIGVGKSGLIGAKMSATFASTGTSSFFVHPTEALHGDLGMIGKDDLVLAISYSGESVELVEILPHLKRLNIPIISFSSNKNSSLARGSDISLLISIDKEACALNIAPTSSTTLTLVLGDAMAVALMKARGFQKEDFASFHPGGKLGKQLFVKAKDFIQTDNLPIVNKNMSLKEAIIEMSSKMLGTLLIVDDNDRLIGIFSDGDFRRCVMRDDFSFDNAIGKYITKEPKTFKDTNILAIDALKIIEQYNIQVLVFVDEVNKINGLIHIHTLVKAGL